MELLKMKQLFLNERIGRLSLEISLAEITRNQVLVELAKIEEEIKTKEEKVNE
jgi:hypothetical protein